MIPIQGFPDYYITESGQIYSSKMKGWPRNGVYPKNRTKPRLKIVKHSYINTDRVNGGYPKITLMKDGEGYNKLVHRLVAEHFIPNPNNLPCACHKDDNPKNPHKDNLFWGTYQDNAQDMIQKGRGRFSNR